MAMCRAELRRLSLAAGHGGSKQRLPLSVIITNVPSTTPSSICAAHSSVTWNVTQSTFGYTGFVPWMYLPRTSSCAPIVGSAADAWSLALTSASLVDDRPSFEKSRERTSQLALYEPS